MTLSRTRKAAASAAAAATQLQQHLRRSFLQKPLSWTQESSNRWPRQSPPPLPSLCPEPALSGVRCSPSRQASSSAIRDGRDEVASPSTLESRYISFARCLLSTGGLRPNRGPSRFKVPASANSVQQVRHLKISGSEVKVGFVIERKGRIEKVKPVLMLLYPFQPVKVVLKTQHTTQGRGGASIQVELRDVQTGLKSTARLRTSEAIEKVFVDERPFTFLYLEDQTAHLMDPSTFEQMGVPKTYFDSGAVYLKDGMDVSLHYFDGKPLSASVPARVTCTVAEAEPYAKGQTATPTYKRVVLDNGVQIMTPSFISAGDVVVVDTTDDSYVTSWFEEGHFSRELDRPLCRDHNVKIMNANPSALSWSNQQT